MAANEPRTPLERALDAGLNAVSEALKAEGLTMERVIVSAQVSDAIDDNSGSSMRSAEPMDAGELVAWHLVTAKTVADKLGLKLHIHPARFGQG